MSRAGGRCQAAKAELAPFSPLGDIAQLVERLVRNEKVRGSNPLISTKPLFWNPSRPFRQMVYRHIDRIATLLAMAWATTSSLSAAGPSSPVAQASQVTEADPPVLSRATEWSLDMLLTFNIEDLRPKAAQSADYESIRLMCFSSRGFVYAFQVVQPRSKDANLTWTEHDFRFQDQPIRSGTVPLNETERLALIHSIDSPAFRTALDDDKPVSIGHPYMYLVEIIEAGSYRIIRRDTPGSNWEERGLSGFNQVTRSLMKLANIAHPDCHAPIPPDPTPASGAAKP